MPFGAITLFLVIVAGLLMLLLSLLKNKHRDKKPLRWLNWLPAPQDNDALIIAASKRLAPKVSLHVVEWEGRKILLAVSDQHVIRLDETAIPAQPLKKGEGC